MIHCRAGSANGQFSIGSDPGKISCRVGLQATQRALEGAFSLSWTGPIYIAWHLHIIYGNVAVSAFQDALKYKLLDAMHENTHILYISKQV